MKHLVIALGLCLTSSSVAVAGGGSGGGPPAGKTLKGAPAKALLRAFKVAGVKATKTKDKWTYKATAMTCHSLQETDDGLGAFDCQVDKQKLANAAAAYL